jgi:dienelactone hydrolase
MMQEFSTVFPSDGVPLVGTFHRSAASFAERQPAVMVSGSWLNVKEQMAIVYARALAERGFTTVVFDFAGWGQSKGALRHAEIPVGKARDIMNAVRFVASQAFVEGSRVSYLGICASAQYALRALADGAPVRSFASVAGWFHDAASVAPFYGGPEGVALRIGRAKAALDRYVKDGELQMVPAYAPGDDRAGMHFELDYYGNRARGAVPAWSNQMAELSWLHWLPYDGISPSLAVAAPTLFVHSDGCALPDNVRRVHANLKGTKELAWLGSGTQEDYYDRPPFVRDAVDRVAAWFEKT